MAKPWTKKNPFMSMWLSSANSIAGSARGRMTAEGKRLIQAGDCVYRGPDFAHRLQLVDGQPVETLFITGPKVRDWGFLCPKGWVMWRDFVGDGSGDIGPGQIGRGCGEMS